jgi:sugar/nucleoside kinase (ribokinase family)
VTSTPQAAAASDQVIDRGFDFTLVGDTNLDLLLYGLPEELPLEQELLASNMATLLGGSGAITAHNLAALGNSVGLISSFADDDAGWLCRRELAAPGVDLSRCLPRPELKTGVTVLLQHHVHRRMFTYAGATFDLRPADLDLEYLSCGRHFHMTSYFLQRSVTAEMPRLFAALKQAGVTISLDTNDDPSQRWDRGVLDAIRSVDLLMPNEREACLLAGERNLECAIAALRQLVPLLVIKRGANGASAYRGAECWHAPAFPVQVVDAVGAGDSFNAGFLHAWLRGWPVEQALAYGNLTGAWSTTASGGTSAFRCRSSLDALIAAWTTSQSESHAALNSSRTLTA